MANGDVIVSATDFNRSVNELESLNETLYSLKNELENITNGISINKEELAVKLEILDKYFIKLDTIQKQILGNKSIDSQYENMLKKILSHFEDGMLAIDKKVNSEATEIKNEMKIVEEAKEAILRDKNKIKTFLEQVQEQLNVASIGTHAISLANSADALEKAFKEQNAIKKTRIYPIFGGVLLGIIFWTFAHFLIKGTLF